MSRDAAGFAGGVKMYTYAGEDPVDLSDSTGMGSESRLEKLGDTRAACSAIG